MWRSFTAVAVALPIVAIVFGIVRSELVLSRAQDFRFEIQGYDPRDLLRGRYLQFRLRIEASSDVETCDEATQECCFCLSSPSAGPTPDVSRTPCEVARAQCDGALQVRYASEPQRFYVPEARATDLEQRLIDAQTKRTAFVVLAVEKDGSAQIRELIVDGEPILASEER